MNPLIRIGLVLWPLAAWGQLELLPEESTQAVFAGRPQKIRVAVHNPTAKTLEREVRTQLFQLSSATVVKLGAPRPWKTLRVLPGQTVLESATLTFPPVRAATRFQVEWTGIGRTDVMVHPDDLLARLKARELVDPDNRLGSLLKGDPEAQLILVWAAELPERVTERIKEGGAAVWIRPSPVTVAIVRQLGAGRVIETPDTALTGLADSPTPQLNLLRLAELALETDNE